MQEIHLSFPSSVHKNSFYYSCFSKIRPGAPAISKTPKCQEVLQDNMKNKNNEKHDFLSIHLVQLEGIRHCLSPPLSPFYRASKYQKVKSIQPSLRYNLELYLQRRMSQIIIWNEHEIPVEEDEQSINQKEL